MGPCAEFQAFDAEACCTYKLHIAVHHVMDQVKCHGAGAGWAEFGVERMVGAAKALARDSKDAPETTYVA